MNSIENLEKSLGYLFQNKDLLRQALTHSSYSNEHNVSHYERLEFLGDAVIELVVSQYIYNNFDLGAGELSKLRAKLVSTDSLSQISNTLHLSDYVLKAGSLTTISKKTNADLFESVIGAIYLDGGYAIAHDMVNKFVIVNFDNVYSIHNRVDDAKSTLQEMLQKDGLTWEYKMIDSFGLDHDKTFVVALYIDGSLVSQAEGKSIHLAQNECARIYLHDMNKL